MLFKRKKPQSEESLSTKEAKAFEKYSQTFQLLKSRLNTMEEKFSLLKNHEKTTEKHVEELATKYADYRNKVEEILNNNHHQLLAKGNPINQLQALEQNEPITEHFYKSFSLKFMESTQEFWYLDWLQNDLILTDTDMMGLVRWEVEDFFLKAAQNHKEGFAITKQDFDFEKYDFVLNRVDLYAVDPESVEMLYAVKATLKEGPYKQALQSQIKAIEMLFTGETGIGHLFAVIEDLEQLCSNMDILTQSIEDQTSMLDEEDGLEQQLEDMDDVQKHLEEARNSFFK